MDNRRQDIVDIIRREFVGPDPIDVPGHIQEDGEEILTADPPSLRYVAGILFPQKTENDSQDSDSENMEENTESSETIPEPKKDDQATSSSKEYLQEIEELLNLSNSYKQSAMSITASVSDGDSIRIELNAAKYVGHKITDEKTGKERKVFYRRPIRWEIDSIPLPTQNKSEKIYVVDANTSEKTSLIFHVTYRYQSKYGIVYTFTLENSKTNSTTSIHDEDCYFQVRFSLSSKNGFASLPDNEKAVSTDNDYLSNRLLYRNVKSYAVGHGCAVEWTQNEEVVHSIETSVIPTYEVKPIIPSSIQGVSLEMYTLSDRGTKDTIIKELTLLCDKYEEWINGLSKEAKNVSDVATAQRHIDACYECLNRMKNGVKLLGDNELVLKAFQLMNRAMLLQQLHYNLPVRSWVETSKGSFQLERQDAVLPDIDDEKTWGDNRYRFGKWRPFQLAFVLINLFSMYDETCEERSKVDLIWFPTGGGKTEAYLGLSAYTIFIRRLKNADNAGTSILMRYTLRLLTSQQYERAAAMICACETIRNENPALLGKERISIGLWVGGDTSPNKMSEAVTAFNKFYNGESSEDNPFLILKCPWCGAQMGVLGKGHIVGYEINKVRTKKRLDIICSNQQCRFSERQNKLPLYLVDEDIYSERPTLLLGTVDKFAMLPYRPEAQSIFGIQNGIRMTAPDLIIQDELHLISGPLGSMVGHYETMIGELCSYEKNGITIKPKVIASTATISRADEQCHALYGCGMENVKQFPPSGLNAGFSFFAQEDTDSSGRMYVGIFAPAASSMASVMIRLYAALLYAAKEIKVNSESERDPYWTNVGYFNSIRELGQTKTWIHADINEYLHVIYLRRFADKTQDYKEKRRYIYSDLELTSRMSSDKIPGYLQLLGTSYPSSDDKRPVDICLATNMISVGVDVPRLGLMTVAGQPKTTSEYIQATSRVGRNKNAPGLVFTVYNSGKPRDRSHYEQFVPYHSKFYCNVEPTSVTPFSAPLRTRALHALIIGLLRLHGDDAFNQNPPHFPDQQTIDRIKSIILDRVDLVEPSEVSQTEAYIDYILENWENWSPDKYQDFNAGDELPLMFPAGSLRNELWDDRGFATPTSMRNVDAECEVQCISQCYSEEG